MVTTVKVFDVESRDISRTGIGLEDRTRLDVHVMDEARSNTRTTLDRS